MYIQYNIQDKSQNCSISMLHTYIYIHEQNIYINRAKSNEFCYEQKSLQNHDDLRRYTIYFNTDPIVKNIYTQPTSQPFRTSTSSGTRAWYCTLELFILWTKTFCLIGIYFRGNFGIINQQNHSVAACVKHTISIVLG